MVTVFLNKCHGSNYCLIVIAMCTSGETFKLPALEIISVCNTTIPIKFIPATLHEILRVKLHANKHISYVHIHLDHSTK